ncbi:MAG: hypothetical protein BMS9Abin03_448 [Thermodesulfobacteriota bacterium]|nr:MAG: hypothetical protein BMS9Abin03_448 [Thermodesulfobacteriota bacterium]
MYKKRSFCFWKILKNRKGFTLTEVTVVLGILFIMTAISVPSYISWLPKHRLQTSVRQICDDMNLAKIRAVKDNKNACITFDTVADTYTIFFDEDGSASYNAGDIIIKGNVPLENGVDITAANTLAFNNRGLSTAGPGQVNLTNPTGRLMGVNVNAAGGISAF